MCVAKAPLLFDFIFFNSLPVAICLVPRDTNSAVHMGVGRSLKSPDEPNVTFGEFSEPLDKVVRVFHEMTVMCLVWLSEGEPRHFYPVIA